MFTIIYINLINLDYDDIKFLINKLITIGFQKTILNNLNFCPYLIIHKDFENNEQYIFENINKGFLDYLKDNKNLNFIEETNIDNFITKAIEIRNNNVNKLF